MIIEGTDIFTITDFDGNFCFTIPQQKVIFIDVSCCYNPLFFKIKPEDNNLVLVLEKRDRKSKRARKAYEKVKKTLDKELKTFYSSERYQLFNKFCD